MTSIPVDVNLYDSVLIQLQQGIKIFLKIQNVPMLIDFIREAVLTVSPNRQYLGNIEPTIPAIHGPAIKLIHPSNVYEGNGHF